MKSKNVIVIGDLTDRTVLTGLVGKRLFPVLAERVSRSEEPEALFLDFNGITASGSFFGQTLRQFRDYALEFNLYPVICNINNETAEELQWFTEVNPDAFIVCKLNGDREISERRWLGVLEEKQRLTFEAVLKEQVTDASSLSKKYESEQIGITGWNNRLSSLAAKGLIAEFRNGRAKSYRPVLENW